MKHKALKATHCKYGHEYLKTGRYSNGRCAECQRFYSKRHYHNNIEKLRPIHTERSRLDRLAIKLANQ